MTNIFRAAAMALRSHVDGTYNLLNAADAVVALINDEVAQQVSQFQPEVISPDGHATYNWNTGGWDYPHEYLVLVCQRDNDVRANIQYGKKIHAIKALRGAAPRCSLAAAKKAVEDATLHLSL